MKPTGRAESLIKQNEMLLNYRKSRRKLNSFVAVNDSWTYVLLSWHSSRFWKRNSAILVVRRLSFCVVEKWRKLKYRKDKGMRSTSCRNGERKKSSQAFFTPWITRRFSLTSLGITEKNRFASSLKSLVVQCVIVGLKIPLVFCCVWNWNCH